MGEVGKGYKIAIETLNEGRIAIGAQMIGLARGALEHAAAYARERKQFGKADRRISGRAVRAGAKWPPKWKPRGCWCTTPHACATPACRS